nr:isoleucine--tRNA ligase, chloroplastic/mitochondrial [Tanacetum cinerariifolium]
DRSSTSGRYWNVSTQVSNFLDHPTFCGCCYDVIAGQPPRVLSVVS